jgi:hypothetical protein
MVRGDIAAKCRRLNTADRSAFRGWILANTVAGAVSIIALIILASVYSGGESSAVTAQKQPTILHAEAH